MSNKKQSSIDWLIGQLKAQYDIDIERLTVTDKAKAMHKEEISNAFSYFGDEYVDEKHCEEYYNETFNSDEA